MDLERQNQEWERNRERSGEWRDGLTEKDRFRERERKTGRGRDRQRLRERVTRLKREKEVGSGRPTTSEAHPLLCLALPLGHCIGPKILAWKAELLS